VREEERRKREEGKVSKGRLRRKRRYMTDTKDVKKLKIHTQTNKLIQISNPLPFLFSSEKDSCLAAHVTSISNSSPIHPPLCGQVNSLNGDRRVRGGTYEDNKGNMRNI
jgi:hypothetical protein